MAVTDICERTADFRGVGLQSHHHRRARALASLEVVGRGGIYSNLRTIPPLEPWHIPCVCHPVDTGRSAARGMLSENRIGWRDSGPQLLQHFPGHHRGSYEVVDFIKITTKRQHRRVFAH